MIHSKLKKGKTSELLVEFSSNVEGWPSVISKFYNTCKDESVKLSKTSGLLPDIIRFYTVQEQSSQRMFEQFPEEQSLANSILKQRVTQIQLQFTVVYINEQNYQILNFQSFATLQNPNPRVLLLRQTLESFFDLDYEVQNTFSQNQSVVYLCELSAMIINSKYEKQVQEHQKRKEKMIRKGNEGELTQMEVIWKNIIFQTPGIGKDKCKLIADKFPTYQHILKDFQKDKKLKNLEVARGTKSIKLGSAAAQRIYKVFASSNDEQKLF